jgi:hypothetical protein
MKALTLFFLVVIFVSCSKKETNQPPVSSSPLQLQNWTVGNRQNATVNVDVSIRSTIRLQFSAPLNRSTLATGISLTEASGTSVAVNSSFSNGDSVINLTLASPLRYLTKYNLSVSTALKSSTGGSLNSTTSISFLTSLDSSRKFPLITDDSLLTLVQKQTFRYFWDFGHPVSGLARERNTSGDLVTSGGTGFGVMAIVVAVHRGFITRAQALNRLQTMVGFLKNTAQKFHGAFPHWMNGATGVVIPFIANDNGADLVETSFLLQGLLTARQYFNGGDAAETALRADINSIWNGVEWSWFRKNNENQLYWHWGPTAGWAINLPIRGWNECLITYVLAASSSTFSIPKIVYDNGWAANGNMRNGVVYYGQTLPLGPNLGGPLFFSHYSFLGINPNSLSDTYANYTQQNTAHSLINYSYCVANPRNHFGYSDSVWGLTASDIPNSYTASSPTNDVGVIAPTAALSSFPYTPTQSMKALKFFYYVLGDKLWGEYGFKDAFRLGDPWFASSYLAIDQGPIIVMMENYRSGLLWNLFMSCPEIKTGMRSLGFQSPYL